MKPEKIILSELKLHDLDQTNIKEINGGGFAYDAGFFLREVWVFMSNGTGHSGTAAVALDLGMNYKPVS